MKLSLLASHSASKEVKICHCSIAVGAVVILHLKSQKLLREKVERSIFHFVKKNTLATSKIARHRKMWLEKPPNCKYF